MYLDLALWVAVMLGTPSSRFDIDGRPAGIWYASPAAAAVSGTFLPQTEEKAWGSDYTAWCSRARCPRRTSCRRAESSLKATYNNPAGSRAYKLYIPSGYHGRPLPLVIMLHGCTQSPDDFAAGTRIDLIAEERACFVAYPAQPQRGQRAEMLELVSPERSTARVKVNLR